MHRPIRTLIIHDVPSEAASLASALRLNSHIQVDICASLEAGINRARDEVFGVVFLSIVMADPRKGGIGELRRRVLSPMIFTLPGTPSAGAFHLEPWEWVSAPFYPSDVQRAVGVAVKIHALEVKLSNAHRRVKDEETLADKGRVAARAAQDFERLLKQIGDGLVDLREVVAPDTLGHLTVLETAVSRAERLCQQLHGQSGSPVSRTTTGLRPVQVNRPTNTILIVDDEESIRELASCVVAQVGWQVVTARDGEEALLRFHAEPNRFTAALLDLSLPRVTGVEVISGIRAMRPGLPIILISGHGDDSLVNDPRLALQGMLRKPFSTDALKAALARVVKDSTPPHPMVA